MEFLNYVFGSWLYVGTLGFMWVQGLVLGYLLWAPSTNFKQGLISGLSLSFLWKRTK